MSYSVLASAYKGSKKNEIEDCLNSLFSQTVLSDDIVIVLDGEVRPDVFQYLSETAQAHPEIKLYPLEKNQGLGNALRYGMQFCKNQLVARMDTDDICIADRMEKQLKCFQEDTNLSIVGSDIAEFIDSPDNIVSYRKVPCEHTEIAEYLKRRDPFNHMTVMFKKSEVERAGGYKDWHYFEDTYLWLRMLLADCRFKNLSEVLVLARIDENTFKRRGGFKYFLSTRAIFKYMKKNRIIGYKDYLSTLIVRFIAYVLLPNRIRQWAFLKFMRSAG